MFLDELNEFADATALDTSGTDTDNLGDVIDLVNARDIGQGQPLYLVIQVTVTITSGGAATVTFQLVSDGTESIATSGQTIHVRSPAIPKATLVAGYSFAIAIPNEGPAYERFLALQTVTATAALTAGAVNAFLTHEPSVIKSYPDAIN